MQFFMYGCMIAISWIGAKAIVASGNNEALGLTTGKLTALITYAMQILMSLMMLSMVFVMIMISRSSTERIVEVLEETTTYRIRRIRFRLLQMVRSCMIMWISLTANGQIRKLLTEQILRSDPVRPLVLSVEPVHRSLPLSS